MSVTIQEKMKSLRDLAKIIADRKAKGKSVVMCHGVFDLLHPGHVRHFEAASREGDLLVVTVTPDQYVNKGPGRPVFPQQLRAEVIASLAPVDYVAINEWPTAIETIRLLQPSVYVKGSDYEDHAKDVSGNIAREAEAVHAVGARLVYTKEITFSSSSLLNNFFNVFSEDASDFLRGFRTRVTEEMLRTHIEKARSCRALVIGDTIIDEYHYCTPMGKSPKENVITTQYHSNEIFAGGVLAAANHMAGLCERVDVVTSLGRVDSREEFVRTHLKSTVQPTIFFRENVPTVVKRRFVEPNYMRKLFEICFLDGEVGLDSSEEAVYRHLDRVLPEYDLVMVTDFGHGMLTARLIDLICGKSRFLAVNAQTNSANIGYNLITKYPRVDYLCIDAPEARLALQDRASSLEDVIRRLVERVHASVAAITHGNHGCVIYSHTDGFHHIPAFTRNVVDTVGAGDAFLSVTSPCVAVGMPVEQVGLVGNAAGALKVAIVGNRSAVEKVPLLKFISTLLK